MAIHRYTLLAVALSVGPMFLASAVPAADDPQLDPANGWVSLFNGKDLSGWVATDRDGRPLPQGTWTAAHGVLTKVGKAYLRTEGKYRDFVLDLEFKVGPQANSGILIRHTPDSELRRQKKPFWWNGLLEIQILDSHDLEINKHVCGALYDMVAPSSNPMKRAGQWNRFRITAVGSKIEVVLNGEKIVDADLSRWTEAGKNPDGTPNKYHRAMELFAHRSGYIWLQDHPGEIAFRNIWIKPQ